MIRNEYLKKMEAKLEELGDDIARIRAKAEKAEGGAREKFREQLEILRTRQEKARVELRNVRDAGAASWGQMKEGVDRAFGELKKSIDEAIAKLRKSA